MRHRSKQNAKNERDAMPARELYRRLYPYCQHGDCDRIATDVHEIASGPARRNAIGERACLLHLCRDHHDQMDDYSIWPIDRQLALKKWSDPEGYSRTRVNEIRGRDPEAITDEEVDRWLD